MHSDFRKKFAFPQQVPAVGWGLPFSGAQMHLPPAIGLQLRALVWDLPWKKAATISANLFYLSAWSDFTEWFGRQHRGRKRQELERLLSWSIWRRRAGSRIVGRAFVTSPPLNWSCPTVHEKVNSREREKDSKTRWGERVRVKLKHNEHNEHEHSKYNKHNKDNKHNENMREWKEDQRRSKKLQLNVDERGRRETPKTTRSPEREREKEKEKERGERG